MHLVSLKMDDISKKGSFIAFFNLKSLEQKKY